MATDADVPAQTLTWTIQSGNIGTAFALSSTTGAVTVVGALNYEARPSYTLAIRATDNGTPALFTTTNFTINVVDVNDVPVINAQSRSIDENTPIGTAVTGGAIIATDEDRPVQTLGFTIVSGNADGAFSIGLLDGVLRVARHPLLDYEARRVYNLIVNVTDTGSPRRWAAAPVTVSLVDVNDPPVLNSTRRRVAENVAVGTAMLEGPLVGGDEDRPVQTLTYTIESGNIGNRFALNASTGVLTVAAATLNFESEWQYNLTVRVTDYGTPQLSSTGVVSVQLVDVNDRPEMNSTFRLVSRRRAVCCVS
jgi:hypothetical protein